MTSDRHIIVIRTGSHDSRRNVLTAEGRVEMQRLAGMLAPLLRRRSVRLACPAEQPENACTVFLASCLGIGTPYNQIELRRDELVTRQRVALDLIKQISLEVDVVLLVIGESQATQLATAICKDLGGFTTEPLHSLRPAQAFAIQLDEIKGVKVLN